MVRYLKRIGAKSIFIDLYDAYNKETFFSDLQFTFDNAKEVLYGHRVILHARCPDLLKELCVESGLVYDTVMTVTLFILLAYLD